MILVFRIELIGNVAACIEEKESIEHIDLLGVNLDKKLFSKQITKICN